MVEKKVLAFYYAWYGTPWGTGVLQKWAGWNIYGYNPEKVTRGRRESAIPCFPLDGLYDSSSEYTIKRHIYQAKQAGLDGFIVSWWGFPDKMKKENADHPSVKSSDATLQKLLEIAPEDFDVTLYYETAEYGDKPVPQNVREDLERIAQEYCNKPRWMKVNGKPVIVIYGRVMAQMRKACADDIKEWKTIREYLKEKGFDLFLVGDSLDPAYVECMDALHTYNPIGYTTRGINIEALYKRAADALHRAGKIFVATVTPGFDNDKVRWPTGERLFEPRRDGGYYIESWNTALSCNPDWIFVTSWNEWFEASQIEPSVEYGYDYIILTKQQVKRFKGN
ncbi:glycoside hydrolase family 99-like domain-containing protein [Candidatus Bathyarchaeota archaeon]|nr:glycoside hydrolase family 99-like domain-containing protein [Candidatus Bathyarchaeota archaeon]